MSKATYFEVLSRSLGGGTNVIKTDRSYKINTLAPRRIIIPHSFYNIAFRNRRLITYTNPADPPGSILSNLTLADGNYDFERIKAAIISHFAFAGITISSFTLDEDFRLTIVADMPFGFYRDTTLFPILGWIGVSGAEPFAVEGPVGVWTLTSPRAFNLVWPRIIYLRLNDNYYLVNVSSPFGFYVSQSFVESEDLRFDMQTNQVEAELLDEFYGPVELNGEKWFLEVALVGELI